MPYDEKLVPTRQQIIENAQGDIYKLIDYLDSLPNLPVGAREAILSDLQSYGFTDGVEES